MDTSRDYSTWFAESFARPIIRDVPMNRGRVLGGTVCAQVATGVKWKACAEIAEVRAAEFEALVIARKAHTQKEIAQAFALGGEIWQRDREGLITAMDKEWS